MGSLLVLLSLTAGCGGEPYCGDGHQDPGEQCDDGNDDETDFCRACVGWLPARTTVAWVFNQAAATGFTDDGCLDVGAVNVRVDLSGPTEVTATAQCSVFQVAFEELPPGSYTARIRPLGAGDVALTGPVEQTIEVTEQSTLHVVNVPPEAWIGPYTGTYLFKIRWGGLDCAETAEGITQQVITLMVGDQVIAQQTEGGQWLDGSDPGVCLPASGNEHQALAIPFGLATIEIVGQDAEGTEHYRGSFETFVGAGPSNPTLEYDVPTIYDAMPDAYVP
jgi:cysteine-rich repeat protein